MQRIFISNNSDVASSDFIIDEDFDATTLAVIDEHKKGNTIFIIDLHCTFKGAEKMQQQGGVIIYRHLLKHFEKCQDKLKVVFYSPLNQAELAAIKPENYILHLLPFIECKYEEGQFKNDLETIIKSNNFPQFNNASENLLNGWALAGQKKITTNNKKILFLDDQQLEWRSVFDEIFEKFNSQNAVLYSNNGSSGRKNQFDQDAIIKKLKNNDECFYNEIKNKIKNNDNVGIILSDFYLIENHDIEVFKESKDIENISGYKMYDNIRGEFPNIPYIFHTSSNKANVYKFFDTRGVDEWIVKDIRINATNKKDHFDYFKKQIEFYTQNPLIDFLKSFWDKIQELENCYKNKWWFTFKYLLKENDSKAQDILKTLNDTWFVFRQQINKETHFEKSIKTSEWDSQSFITAAIINTLNQIKEILRIEDTKKEEGKKPVANFYGQLSHTISKIRNAAAHSKNDSVYTFKLLDAQIFTNLILDLLCLDDDNINEKYPLNNKKIRYLKISKRDFNANCNDSNSFKHELFWIYAQMYCLSIDNSKVYYDSENILKRLKEMYPTIKDCEDFINKLNNYYIKKLSYFKNNWHTLITKLDEK